MAVYWGQLPVLVGDNDISHKVLGNTNSKNIYINGILNNKQDMQAGADNLIGIGADNRQIWENPSHGLLGDLLEVAVDLANGLELQTGISKQLEKLQADIKNKGKVIYMHSGGNAATAEGARNLKNEHTYNSYGSPMGKENTAYVFKDDGELAIDPNINPGDYVANPLNIFKPSTWNQPGHGHRKLWRC